MRSLSERSRDGRGKRGLADAGLPFEEQRALQAKRQKKRNRKAAVRDVVLAGQPLLKLGDGCRNGDAH